MSGYVGRFLTSNAHPTAASRTAGLLEAAFPWDSKSCDAQYNMRESSTVPIRCTNGTNQWLLSVEAQTKVEAGPDAACNPTNEPSANKAAAYIRIRR